MRLPTTMTNKKTYTIAGILMLIIIAGLTVTILRGISAWFDRNTLQFNQMVEVKFNKPIEVKERQIEVAQVVKVMETIPHPEDLETDTEKYIYEVFGIEDYKIALAIARSESGLREDAINAYNTNGTIDVGIFQINSVHFSKEGCSLKEVATMQGNVDCAYSIYKQSGWNPWVVFQTGAFKNKL